MEIEQPGSVRAAYQMVERSDGCHGGVWLRLRHTTHNCKDPGFTSGKQQLFLHVISVSVRLCLHFLSVCVSYRCQTKGQKCLKYEEIIMSSVVM